MDNKLTKEESSRFKFFHDKAMQYADEFCTALKIIRDEQLFRGEYSTFAQYIEKNFKVSKSQAYRLIDLEDVKNSPIGGKIENERQARAILEVPEPQREKVIEVAVSKGKVTAKSIAEIAATLTEPPSEEPERENPILEPDETGYPIPYKAMKMWNRRSEITAILADISKARTALKKYEGAEDLLFKRTPAQEPLMLLNNAYNELKTVVPYAVCPYCQGEVPQNCLVCMGSGFLGKFHWDTVVPSELKELRRKAAEQRAA